MTQTDKRAHQTPGPWVVRHDKGMHHINGNQSRTPVASAYRDLDAHRIVAAVNACEGISTEVLEAGVVADLLAALEELLEEVLSDEWHQPSEYMEQKAKAAITKAKGQ